MGFKRQFEIAFVGLKPGVHVYEYNIDNKFFDVFAKPDFENCKATVKLSLEKHNGFMQLHFDIGGNANVWCDRCGNPLTKDLWEEFDVIVKLVENPDEMNEQENDPDIYYISRTESHLDVSSWIYEFVALSVPTQKTCTEEEFDEGSLCNKEVLHKLQQMEEEVAKQANPLWKGLDKFKNLDN